VDVKDLTAGVVRREPLAPAGASGNRLERITFDDGVIVVSKRVSPTWDWISRATGDDGRVAAMWEGGLFDRMPPIIDHATLGVERGDREWTVYMGDVSSAMIDRGRRLGRDEVRRVLDAVAELHLAFWGEPLPALCGLEDRYHLLSPRTARRETDRGEAVGDVITRCWEMFAELAPPDIADVVVALAEDSAPLAEELSRCEQTLIHGDVRLNNLGLHDDRVVLVDWGERTGAAPAAVELASFLVFDAHRFDVSRDDVIEDFRGLYGDRFDPRALELALIGGLVQLGCNFALPIVLGRGDEALAAAKSELAWWAPRVAKALETWSPA
jgi:Phosphotransferase enzyme family